MIERRQGHSKLVYDKATRTIVTVDPHLEETVAKVALAINAAWNEFGDVPFPLYQHEAEALAKAAIAVMRPVPHPPAGRTET